MSRVRITKLKIRNYKGVLSLDRAIPEAGAIFAGMNMGGKTSILDALRAALGGVGIDASSIRLGETAAEILVDLDAAEQAVCVRRTISPKGSTVTAEVDGVLQKSPVAWLRSLLGTSALDPIELFAEKDKKKRRAIILAALPAKLTEQHLTEWLSDRVLDLPSGLRAKALAGHGLDGIASIREHFYDARAEANKVVRGLSGELSALESEVEALTPPGPAKAHGALSLVGGKATPKTKKAPVTRAGAEAERTLAVAAQSIAVQVRNRLEAQAKSADAQGAKTASARALIQSRRDDASAMRERAAEGLPYDPALAQAVLQAKEAMEAAREALRVADERNMVAMKEEAEQERTLAAAADLEKMAHEMESALGASALEAPSAEELTAACAAETAAAVAVEKAQAGVRAAELHEKIEGKRASVTSAQAEAAELTVLVDRMSKDAPKQLIHEANMIPGLDVGTDDIKLDGVAIDGLSGREQLCFAIDIARRANPEAKLLIVDRLETLDPDQLALFVKEATRDGVQVIGTRVAKGDVVVESLTVDEAAQ
jgi:hypothetical protein